MVYGQDRLLSQIFRRRRRMVKIALTGGSLACGWGGPHLGMTGVVSSLVRHSWRSGPGGRPLSVSWIWDILPRTTNIELITKLDLSSILLNHPFPNPILNVFLTIRQIHNHPICVLQPPLRSRSWPASPPPPHPLKSALQSTPLHQISEVLSQQQRHTQAGQYQQRHQTRAAP